MDLLVPQDLAHLLDLEHPPHRQGLPVLMDHRQGRQGRQVLLDLANHYLQGLALQQNQLDPQGRLDPQGLENRLCHLHPLLRFLRRVQSDPELRWRRHHLSHPEYLVAPEYLVSLECPEFLPRPLRLPHQLVRRDLERQLGQHHLVAPEDPRLPGHQQLLRFR